MKQFFSLRLLGLLGLYSAIILSLTAIAISAQGLHWKIDRQIFSENGYIENITAFLYLLAIIILFAYGRATSLKSHWYMYIIIAALGLRELDFDKKFTEIGILRSKFLFSPEVSLPAKAIGLCILITLIIAIVTLAKKHLVAFYRGSIKLATPEWALGFGFVMIILSKQIDGFERKIAQFNLTASDQAYKVIHHCEELYELMIPIALILAIVLYSQKQRSSMQL